MKNISTILIFTLFFAIFPSCSEDTIMEEIEQLTLIEESPVEESPAEETTNDTEEANLEAVFYNNISYGESSDQVYDIYLPNGRDLDTKVMILVHGGGWISGDKSNMFAYGDFFQSEFPQMAVVNLNYRLADEDNPPYPMQINDITTVVTDLKEKQEEYQISQDYGMLGSSAGGHLVLLWTYAFDVDDNVGFVTALVPPTNLRDDAYLNNSRFDEYEYLFGRNLDFLQEVSPLYQLSPNDPPTQLFYGGRDDLIPPSQGLDMRCDLESYGIAHEYTVYPEEEHSWEGANLDDTRSKIRQFVQDHFGFQ